MRAVGAMCRRFFSAKGKSPLRNGIETAGLLAAIFLAFYAWRASTTWRLILGAINVAALGFVLGFGTTIYSNRRRRG
jgi:hypothetical protein